MTDEEQHSYRDALDKVSRCPPTTSLAPALTGTPVPSRQTLVNAPANLGVILSFFQGSLLLNAFESTPLGNASSAANQKAQ